jgi:hypothetical protein
MRFVESRPTTLALATIAALALAACASAPPRKVAASQPAPREAAPPAPAPEKPKSELPRGGRVLFPEHRLVGFCGTPGGPALGELQGNLTAKTKALLGYAEKYAGSERKILPVFELIAVVVQAGSGADGKYRRRVEDSVVDTYLRHARESKGIFLLNIQPGQSDFLTEVKHFEKYLREPDVGVALDPEWAMKTGQKPGKVYGQTTGAMINSVAEYMSKLTTEGDLPEKALVFHQVNRAVVKDEPTLQPYPGVVLIKSVDGLGPKAAKIETYLNLMEIMGPRVHAGFKLFFDEDHRNGGQLMTPAEVLALKPPPEYVMYE